MSDDKRNDDRGDATKDEDGLTIEELFEEIDREARRRAPAPRVEKRDPEKKRSPAIRG